MTRTTILPSGKPAADVYKRLLGAVKPYWVFFALGIFGTVIYSGIDSSLTYMIKPALDQGFIARNQAFISWVPLILAGVFIARSVAGFMSTYFIYWVGRKVVMNFRQQIFSHLLVLPAEFFESQTSGALLSVIIYNVEQVAEASTTALLTLVRESVFIAGLCVVMLVVSWQLTLTFLLTAPFMTIIVRYSSRRLRRLSKEVQGWVGNITHIAEEGIQGNKVIRTYGGEAYEVEKFNKATEENRRREMKAQVTNGLTSPIIQGIAGCVIIFTVYLATQHVENITAGGFASIIVAMLAILKPIKNLTSINTPIQKGIAAADSIFTLLDIPAEVDSGTKTIDRAVGELIFDHVTFKYKDAPTNTLEDIHFTLKPGRSIALVGRSGAGKSTIVSLLPRFYNCHAGSICLDGVDINELTLASLRNQFAFVSQHVILFNDTIAHNIAYGTSSHASEEQIIAAAEAAHAMEFIKDLPEGLQTQIGEKGLKLSGGQRQRIAIARAILKDAPLLILDEATSALDTESERHIQAALENLMKNRSTIVIAHRLSTIENVDEILVMDEGKIVEQGTHAELLARDDLYARLYNMQFKEASQA